MSGLVVHEVSRLTRSLCSLIVALRDGISEFKDAKLLPGSKEVTSRDPGSKEVEIF